MNVPDAVTGTVREVEPLLQAYLASVLDVKLTAPPLQKKVGPSAVIIGFAGLGFTVIAIASDLFEQPNSFVTVTE